MATTQTCTEFTEVVSARNRHVLFSRYYEKNRQIAQRDNFVQSFRIPSGENISLPLNFHQ